MGGAKVIRLVAFIVLAGVFFAVVTHLNPWVFIIPIGILGVLAYTVGGMKLRCPKCGKRIKLGYSTCHHCGATFGNAR